MAIKKLDVASLSEKAGLKDYVLVLRPKARKMYELSKEEIGSCMSDDVVICDLHRIQDCSSSFVDEFLLNWQREINEVRNAVLVLVNANDDVLYTVEAALNQRNRKSNESLSLLVYSNGRYTAIGNRFEKNVLQVFDLIAEGKHITAREVADRFDLELNSAGNRLKKLYDAHVVVRVEQSQDAGGKFEYYIPKIK